MSDGYTILSLDEVETVPGFRAAGVNVWRADSGGALVPDETDGGHEKLYAVVRGRARFTVGEEEADAPAGTLVFVPPAVARAAVAVEDGTIVFAVGGTAGEPFA